MAYFPVVALNINDTFKLTLGQLQTLNYLRLISLYRRARLINLAIACVFDKSPQHRWIIFYAQIDVDVSCDNVIMFIPNVPCN